MPDTNKARRDSLVRHLRRHVAGEVRFDDTSRRLYATDASHYQIAPLGVVLPRTEDDLTVAVQAAAELDIPITARGGGTSLSGQSIGPGLVIDCSKYLTGVGDVDIGGRCVRVQPGVVLDQLNRTLARHGLMFAPDVATASRATVGGMIGNNSAGARSVVYGQTGDHVRSLDVVLADGTRTTFGSLTPAELQRKRELRTREGDIYRGVERVVRENETEIAARFPTLMRKVSGYNLLALTSGGVHPRRPSSLLPLLVGSEGTLGVVAAAELALVPKPVHRGLLVPQFDTLAAALDAVACCLSFNPSAVELMDRMLLDLARTQRALKTAMAVIRGTPEAVLMVEFSGDDAGAIADQVEQLSRALRGAAGLTAAVTATDPQLRDPLWNLRSAAVPLLYGLPGKRKPVTFVEDTAVSPEKLPAFVAGFREVLARHGTHGAFYGHASVGCLHIRPVLDIHDPTDVKAMRAIMTDIAALVRGFGGSLSGEHGDGLVRSEWNKVMFGDAVYAAFKQVKRAFDPDNVLNPGKVVDGPAMEDNFRPPAPPGRTPLTVYDYSNQGGFFQSAEVCNGAGVCRKTQGGAMCPSYRATMDEQHTPRGRANAMRHALTAPPAEPGQRWVADVMALCLGCKACKTECPANVDVAKLKGEFLHAFYLRRPRPLLHRLVRRVRTLSKLAAPFAGPANWLGRRGIVRRGMELAAGVDRRRSLPELHTDHFRQWFARRPTGTGRRVILLDDCFTTYQEPHIGRAAVAVLDRLGYAVELANVCCGRAAISLGYLNEAKTLARAGIERLSAAARDGIPILGLEPSCILTLADEWPDLLPGDDAKRVAANVHLADAWLAAEMRAAGLKPPAGPPVALVHPHCHQMALVGSKGTLDALALVPGLTATPLDAGCCGMAGSFGYERDKYDVSIAVANLALIPGLAADPAATVVATGTSCRHQIFDRTGRRAMHPVELLAGDATRPPGSDPS